MSFFFLDRLKVNDLKNDSRNIYDELHLKSQVSCQLFYSRSLLYCGLEEKCILGRMPFLATVPRAATGGKKNPVLIIHPWSDPVVKLKKGRWRWTSFLISMLLMLEAHLQSEFLIRGGCERNCHELWLLGLQGRKR